MSCNLVVGLSVTAIPKWHKFYNSNRPQFVEVDPKFQRRNQPPCALAAAPIRIWSRCCTSDWNQASSTDALSHLTSTKENQAPVEDGRLGATLERQMSRGPNIRLSSDTTTTSVISVIRAVAQTVENNDAEKEEVAQKLQEVLWHQATDAICKQAAKMEVCQLPSIPLMRMNWSSEWHTLMELST